jgi:glycolate oxidase iron-sulfur subunit
MHLVDQARVRIEEEYMRPFADRLMRNLLAFVMPRPGLFGLSLAAARLARPFRGLAAAAGASRIAALLDLVPSPMPKVNLPGVPGTYAAEGAARGRVALLMGCVQSVLDRDINAAAIRLLTRIGYDVVVAGGEPCCGSLTHHMGKERDALARARRSIDQWMQANVDAVVVTASGCGTTIKDYGHMLRLDPAYADKAAAISAKTRDICEFLDEAGLPRGSGTSRVAYHAACSLQHGQQVRSQPMTLLRQAGFDVAEVPEGHLCCGSAGTYNIMQPDIALMLRERKVSQIESVGPEVIAAGNIGCMTQIAKGTGIPVVHTVELLDWAHGGPRPAKLVGA